MMPLSFDAIKKSKKKSIVNDLTGMTKINDTGQTCGMKYFEEVFNLNNMQEKEF